jgi:hypothetical protein
MVLGHGPDFKAQTDLLERRERARIEAQKAREAPERLRHEPPMERLEKPDLLARLWRRFFG